MKIGIANDHGGFILKSALVKYLEEQNYEVVDFGSDSGEIVRYPYYAAKVARAIQNNEVDRGILICSTGIGMSIAANKYKGIRAAVCYSSYQAKMTAAHNRSNVLCLGGRCVGDFEAIDFLEKWLSTEYEGGRHNISLGLIEEIESHNVNDESWEFDKNDL